MGELWIGKRLEKSAGLCGVASRWLVDAATVVRASLGTVFLPAIHQASIINADAPEPVRDILPKEPDDQQRRRLSFVGKMDRRFETATGDDPQIESAIRNYEMAYRMQSAVPELVDISGETEATKKLYGLDSPEPKKAAYARQCLLARRLVERGVRFVELTCLSYNIGGGNGPNPWDQHAELRNGHEKMAFQVDQPIAGLLKDLKSRGLLDDTLVIFSGEFGRTPFFPGGPMAAITTPSVSACGWPAAASAPARSTAPPTTSATAPSKSPARPTTSGPPCSANSASITTN
jgi:hypothetical protein